MKKIKKLTLNKEIISILGGNEMNVLKGGTYCPNDAIPPPTMNTICCPPPLPTPTPCGSVVSSCNGATCPVVGTPKPKIDTEATCIMMSCLGSCGEVSCYIDECWPHAEY